MSQSILDRTSFSKLQYSANSENGHFMIYFYIFPYFNFNVSFINLGNYWLSFFSFLFPFFWSNFLGGEYPSVDVRRDITMRAIVYLLNFFSHSEALASE